ncbi:MAG: flippase-like domain-containing protein [Patescibacteria group bacterium]|nr:flippase-like domain-containing protein [Patescibacteria group bacterium]
MKPLRTYLAKKVTALTKQQRDARYVFVFIISLLVFVVTYLQARTNGLFDSFERPIFSAVNQFPHSLYPLFYTATQLGNLGSLLLWVGTGWYLINRRAGITTLYAGIIGYFLAKYAKASVHRGRPGAVLQHVHLFSGEKFTGFGFPSGHSTVSAACATVLYYQVAPKYRKYLLLAVFMVGLSRMYLGAHFPLDVVGGWALGALVGSIVMLVAGVSKPSLSAVKLKKYLRRRGYDIKSLRYANVDARGSRPVFIIMNDGQQYFAKIFGKHEHAADWLFKIYRFFRYKNLQAEEPYVNSRRNIELEAFATLWAKQAGVRAAKVIDTIRIGKLWILIQAQVPNSVPFNEYKALKESVLNDAWQQVKLLHDSNMAHRDLRAANLLVDNKQQVWLIDFGFAEVSPNKQRLSMDIAELLMSMSLLAGVKATVKAARSAFDDDHLQRALPYLQKAVFSGETTKQLKQQKTLLAELKTEMKHQLGITEAVDTADILRLNKRKAFNLALIAVFIYAVLPQFNNFRGTLEAFSDVNLLWLPFIIGASMLTYLLTGLIYVILVDVPLKLLPTTLVQLAASFVSKIVPGGLGGGSLNARYFTKAGIGVEESSAVIVSATAIGFFMFAVPLIVFLLLTGGSVFKLVHLHIPAVVTIAILASAVISAIVLTISKKLRRKVYKSILQFVANLRDIATSPRQLTMASVTSLLVSLAYIACLYFCLRAYGVHLSVLSVVVVYATAIIAKSTIPTPGGLGPLEIAMVSSLLGFGVDKPLALAAIILYRLATFWVPIPFSLLAYRYIEKLRLI